MKRLSSILVIEMVFFRWKELLMENLACMQELL